MTVKIVSNGKAKETRVYTESGEDISRNIRSININIQAGGLVIATMEFFDVEVDGDAYLVSKPLAGLLRLFRRFVKRLGE